MMSVLTNDTCVTAKADKIVYQAPFGPFKDTRPLTY
jgi:hypothetical protein